ncbi:hypothetical protein HD554DRAFT_2036671 [Boletus coccyginus]|nr:hypothetical protein HD554DRAFT_2042881 [Boletus coccyginus]KAI9571779.1 hypothetical protein HD554DRAFT_2036671 [Boletus coccyginus]
MQRNGARRAVRELSASQRTANQEKDTLNKTIDSLRADLRTRDKCSSDKITHLEQIIQELRVQLADAERKADVINHAHEKKHQCESLYAQGRIQSAAECLLEIVDTVNEDVRANKFIFDWLTVFTHRCIMARERDGDEASNAGKQDEAVTSYSTALSLGPTTPDAIMMKWASIMLIHGSADEASTVAAKFKVPMFVVYRVICDILEGDDRLAETVECFQQMQNELSEDAGVRDERAEWELNFRGRCIEKLEQLGDIARDSQKHDEAIGYYSNALSLDPTNNDILLKRSKEDIELDPSSYMGYERKHAALHGMGRYGEAFEAFRVMLSTLEQSPDPHTHDGFQWVSTELRNQYVDVTATIQDVVEETIRDMPRVLIDTTTGRLYDKTQQAAAFQELPIYNELRSSMTTRLDHARVEIEVKEFYRYVMLSHRWQPPEPTFQMVENTSIYVSWEQQSTKWAWSDTCCVNQEDKGVQQESVVAMFRWYRGSSLTIVHLLGVFSESQVIGCLWRSIWNTRGWTYQEYVASKVVQFYTEDWKPYLGLDIFNHKESPVILSEMEQAMNFATQELASLEPGLDRVREKLYLASRRRTTREEDIAYSLFGIFSVPIPVIYGEGNQAVSRLLEHILTRSGDITLLAWTGRSLSSYHSYLPAELTVYNEIVPPHVPRPMETAEMDGIVTALRSSSPDPSLAVALYRQLNNLPPLSLFAGRLTLHGIVFPLDGLVPLSDSETASGLVVYHATSPMLGDIEFETTDKLSGVERLLIHPWINPLLDRDFSRGVPQFDLATRALRLVARLRQRFGALLLATQAREQFKRVATDSMIMVRVREETSPTELMDGIRTVHIHILYPTFVTFDKAFRPERPEQAPTLNVKTMARRPWCAIYVRRGTLGLSVHSPCPSSAPLRGSEPDHGEPCTVQAEVDKEGWVRACGFEPAKTLVRGLPLPLPLSFRDRLGYQLPILSPVEGVGQTTKWPATAGARPQID